ncbi:S9 family peptidase [Nakamurella endophytica]|uniref:Dipeptidyl aminopeptidase n=1 Tax=Nakamurella endophytica TaxID=1748367 RepID=A0A917SPJ5_9ACTN|nr:S9 family peptidase [Nakamurella endophytica]GGL91034.1 dipeptidyl aminopeptidase [Nakamurella endophytica]
MHPEDIERWTTLATPAVGPDGTVMVAAARPDADQDHYHSEIVRIAPSAGAASEPDRFTAGDQDSAPVLSPDGRRMVFLRRTGTGRPQLFECPVDGGEPRALAEHPLGAGPATFSPDGTRIVYLAAVPEPGRYGTDDDVPADGERPRRIDRLAYRSDGKGFVLDRPDQVFVQDLGTGAGADAVRLTDEPAGARHPAWTADGTAVLYARASGPDRIDDEIVRVDVPSAADRPAAPQVVVRPGGSAQRLVVDGDTVYYLGAAFPDQDWNGRNTSLWAAPAAGGPPRRMTDEETVDVDAAAGNPVVSGDRVLVAVLDRGASTLAAVPLDARDVRLGDLPLLVGGARVVKGFAAAGEHVVAVVSDPGTPGELVRLGPPSSATPGGPESATPGTAVTDVAAPLREAGLARHVELTATSSDGYPVHGFLVLPPGPGPHPVLLDVHGGPHAAYGWGLFDEAQVYAGAGYAVVLPNPRGSAGYGQDHGRAAVRRFGTVDVADVLALLDAALELPECDGRRVGVMGGSYGGFMTSWLASHAPERFVAGISERAVNAWDSFRGSSDIGYFFASAYVGDDRETLWEISPLAHADDIRIPLLIIHSEQDWRCPVEQAQRLYTALKLRGAETEMLLFPGEGHELSRSGRPRHRLQRFAAILEWWSRYLPVEGGGVAQPAA